MEDGQSQNDHEETLIDYGRLLIQFDLRVKFVVVMKTVGMVPESSRSQL
jgi:hypothetical protein